MDEKRVKKVIWMLIILAFIHVDDVLLQKSLIEIDNPTEDYNLATIKGIIEYKKGKFIKREESKTLGYNIDIYAELGPDLFDPEDDMRKQFYTNMFVRLSRVLSYQNFRIIDESKDIIIGVKCDDVKAAVTEIKVNGDGNYWGNIQSQYNLYQLGNNQVNSRIYIQAKELTQLINNEWNRASLKLDDSFKTVLNYDVFSDKGIEIRTVNRKIFNIVFTADYKENVVNDIKTTTSLEDVIKLLGDPTIGSLDEGVIGYRGNDIYVFFLNNNEISVYRIEKYENLDDYFKIVKQFESDRDIKQFVNNLTDIWPDWDVYEYNSTLVDLRYTLKGLKIQFGVSQNNGFIYDRNYIAEIREGLTIQDIQQDITKIPNATYFENEDYIFQNEYIRFMNKTNEDIDD